MITSDASLPELLDEAASAFTALEDAVQWQPRPHSIASMEQEENAAYAAAWGDEPVSIVYALAVGMLHPSIDHLRALSRSVAPSALEFSPATLARSSAEAAGRAAWILDPSLDVRGRLARGFTEVLYSGYEQLKLRETIGEDALRAVLYDETLSSAEQHSFTIVAPKRRAPALEEERPWATVLFRELDDNPDLGVSSFRILSAGTHSTAYSTLGQLASSIVGGLEMSAMRTATRWMEAYTAIRFLGKAVGWHLRLIGGDEQAAVALKRELAERCKAEIGELMPWPATTPPTGLA